MTKLLRAWWLRKRITWQGWDVAYWRSGISVGHDNARESLKRVRAAEAKREELKRQLRDLEYHVPRGLLR